MTEDEFQEALARFGGGLHNFLNACLWQGLEAESKEPGARTRDVRGDFPGYAYVQFVDGRDGRTYRARVLLEEAPANG